MNCDARPASVADEAHGAAAACKCCSGRLVGARLDLGPLPACNRFEQEATAAERHALAIAECGACGLVQLAAYPPAEVVMPRVPWIKYREPDAHLKDLAAKLERMAAPYSSILGVGPFDEPLTVLLAKKGRACRVVDLSRQVDVAPGRFPYLETMQRELSEMRFPAGRGERYELVVCRYLLEHCHDPLSALETLKRLLAPGGKLLIEVPDCEKFLARCDYSFVWEEHICYFTEGSLRSTAQRAGFRILDMIRYDGALEDALVIVLQASDAAAGEGVSRCILGGDRSRLFDGFVKDFGAIRDAWRARLRRIAAEGRKIALFGAGHQGIMFVNALGLQGYIARLVDDQPEKQGYYSPGIAARITSSASLAADGDIGAWLLAVSPASQALLQGKYAAVVAKGVEMHSIFERPPANASDA